MKQFVGKTKNITSPIIGKITKQNIIRFWERSNYIIVSETFIKKKKYAAQITKLEDVNKISIKQPIVYQVNELDIFNDGDIILIDKNGLITFLFENEENFNPILVTERCNANCIACPQPKVQNEDDKSQLNFKLISLINKDAKTVGITGGEPTLLGRKFLLLLEQIKAQLPKTNILLLSNGIRFSDYEFTRKLYLLDLQNLQIDIPLFSDIDSLHDEIMQTKCFYNIISGLYNLAKFNFKIGLRVVILKMNYQRLYQIAEFIYRNFPFVYHIAFIQMEVIGLERKNIDKVWINPLDFSKELERAVNYLYNRKMRVSIYNSQLCLLPKSIWRFALSSISSWKRIYLDICEDCDIKDQCGGLFESSTDYLKNILHPIRETVSLAN